MDITAFRNQLVKANTVVAVPLEHNRWEQFTATQTSGHKWEVYVGYGNNKSPVCTVDGYTNIATLNIYQRYVQGQTRTLDSFNELFNLHAGGQAHTQASRYPYAPVRICNVGVHDGMQINISTGMLVSKPRADFVVARSRKRAPKALAHEVYHTILAAHKMYQVEQTRRNSTSMFLHGKLLADTDTNWERDGITVTNASDLAEAVVNDPLKDITIDNYKDNLPFLAGAFYNPQEMCAFADVLAGYAYLRVVQPKEA